jgi:hypothetical protein
VPLKNEDPSRSLWQRLGVKTLPQRPRGALTAQHSSCPLSALFNPANKINRFNVGGEAEPRLRNCPQTADYPVERLNHTIDKITVVAEGTCRDFSVPKWRENSLRPYSLALMRIQLLG